MTNAARVIVAIPTRNEAATIAPVLLSLVEAKVADLRIVVVDAASSDDTCAIVRRLAEIHDAIHLIELPGGNIATAVNRAARTSAADILVRCDAHAIYPKDFVPKLIATLQRTGATSVVVPMDSLGRSCFQKAVAWVSDMPVGSGGARHRGGRISGFIDHGHHAAFRLDAFLAAGGYDETVSHNEDAELDCRLGAAGGRIYLDADIRIAYYPRATPGALWRQYFHYGRGRSRTMRRHRRSIRARQLAAPGHALVSLASFAAAVATCRVIFLAWPLLYLMLLAGTSFVAATRAKSLCGLLAGPAAFIMHTAWAAGFFAGTDFLRAQYAVAARNRSGLGRPSRISDGPATGKGQNLPHSAGG